MRSSDSGTVHIVGAGLAGLAAAVSLSGSARKIVVHEATLQPGGRCRSFQDAATGMLIDNGTHLLLSGNSAALSYAATIGSRSELIGPAEAEFSFVDIADGARWTVQFSGGRIPWWVFDKDRRVPQTSIADYLALAPLIWTKGDKPLGTVMNCAGPLFDRFIEPILLAALNISPRDGSSKLATALLRETIVMGGKACRPLLARDGIGKVFIEPALRYLRSRATISLQDELRVIEFSSGSATRLDFTTGSIVLGDGDAVVLAVPPYIATALLPGLQVPTQFRGIVNAHFRADPPNQTPAMLGVLNGTCEWIFAKPGHISVTVSDASRLFDMPKAELAQQIWNEVAAISGLSRDLPPWQLVRERRATFAATPEQNALRPGPETPWRNVYLAGDWTATDLPATIEGAVRSGYRAADMVSRALQEAA
jgi:squalene-associated FAD-dependent desaturase